jgi:phosphatidate cytidylyltransferase
MMQAALWQDKLYVETVTIVMGFLFVMGAALFYMKTLNPKWLTAWLSLKSWVFASPFVFIFAGLPDPWPFIGTVLAAVFGVKTFYRMTGMYHRTWFVVVTYGLIWAQGYLVYKDYDRFFNIMPMAFFLILSLVPILKNNSTQMIQFLALTLMSFILFGWSFLHVGRMIVWDNGIYIVIYLFILSEINETAYFAGGRMFGRHKMLQNISSRFTVEGFIFSIVITTLVAWGLRRMLPERTEIYWLTATFAIAVVGRVGSLLMSGIRRDLGVKESSVFIIGRDDILGRIDKITFAAPVIFYAYLFIQGRITL